MPRTGGFSRVLLTLGGAGLALGLVEWMLSRPTPTAPPPTPTAISATATPRVVRTPVENPTAPAPHEDVVAWVDGTPLPAATLAERMAADRALSALFGITTTDEDAALDRFINETLVLRAAEAAGFYVSSEIVTDELAALLAAHNQSHTALETALLAEGVTLDAFSDYFARLITARDFAAAQASGTEEYIRLLRRSADIRLSPAGAVALPTLAPLTLEPTATPDASRGTAVGQVAPNLSLPLLGGNPSEALTLDVLRGRPVVLVFWVTWCGHCRAQTPLLIDAHQQHPEVAFVGVNLREPPNTVQAYVAEQGIPYTILLDADGSATQQFQVSGLPTTYFIDAEGRIAARHSGQLTAESLASYMALLLGQGR